MRILSALLSILSVACLASAQNPCSGCFLCPQASCGSVCRFRMCDFMFEPGPKRILMRPALSGAFNPTICGTSGKVSFVLKTGEPVVETAGGDFPISQYTAGGLVSPRFDRRYFLTSKVRKVGQSVVVRKAAQGNQEQYLDGLCIRLPIVKYLRKEDGKSRKIRTRGNPADCVAFSTRTAKLFIEVLWESADDLDLIVNQPNNENLSRFNRRSKETGGRFSRDSEPDCNSERKMGAESVKYFNCANLLRGDYTVQVRHFKNCGAGATKWTLRASLDGILLFEKKGTSNGADEELITSEVITIP